MCHSEVCIMNRKDHSFSLTSPEAVCNTTHVPTEHQWVARQEPSELRLIIFIMSKCLEADILLFYKK